MADHPAAPGEAPPQGIAGGAPNFVDADTALAFLRRMIEKGLSDKLRNTLDEVKVWVPDAKNKASGDEPPKD